MPPTFSVVFFAKMNDTNAKMLRVTQPALIMNTWGGIDNLWNDIHL